MIRTICSVLAAAAATVTAVAPAHAEGRYEARQEARHEPFAVRAASAWERRHEREWARLQRTRHRFYKRWNGNPYERARFERWYAHRCDELRRW